MSERVTDTTQRRKPALVHTQSVDEVLDALVARHGLPGKTSQSLHEFVRLVDWGERNGVPKANPDSRPARALTVPEITPEAHGLRALRVLSESLAATELDAVANAGRIADLGSGAGFPGMVLAIVLPETHVTLVESDSGKCAFLQSVIDELALPNAEVVQANANAWADGQGVCDVVTSRKMGRIEKVFEWSLPLLAPGGAIVRLPGNIDTEVILAAGNESADAAGLRLAQVQPVPMVNRKGAGIHRALFVYVRAEDPEPAASAAGAA